ncbi:MAG: hypothetical protein GY953_19805, partial [bacterium]|nr:hypothetical protein [bacterium]
MNRLSGGYLRLVWAATENLGDWSIVRRRLSVAMRPEREAPAAGSPADTFEPFAEQEAPDTGGYFVEQMGRKLKEAKSAGWSAESPASVLLDDGKHQWPLASSPEAIPVARHAAPSDDQQGTASPVELAARAEGHKAWGVLRGDVDNLEGRMRGLSTIEEHVQLSVIFKQFFAGELEVLCSMPEFWQKVSVIYSGGDDFSLYGSWDALILIAREIQRLFHRFNEESLKDVPGSDAKTISMAISFAPSAETSLIDVYKEAGRKLEIAKSTEKDCLYLFGRTVEWRHLSHAVELKDNLGRMVREFDCPPEFLEDMMRFYDEKDPTTGEAAKVRFERPWRYHRRLNLWSGGARDREFQRLRTRLIVDLIGKNA